MTTTQQSTAAFPKKIGTAALISLILVFTAGAFLRFWDLGSSDPTFDEGIYAFRSIGYLDYMENPDQLTPIQHFADREMPGWLSLSFHDAPPLFFLIGHAFFTAFGQSLLVARLPSALAGLGAIILLFFITRLIFSKFADVRLREWKDWAGVLAAAIGGVSSSAVALSRLDQLESVLFFFILLNMYFFLRFLTSEKWWWAFGVSFGLCLLIKYTAVFLVPAYFLCLALTRSPLLKNWHWYFAFLLSLILFSPIIVYNVNFYRTFGHFDLQFAYLFHQKTPEWQGVSGKSQEPFGNILENLRIIYSIPYLLLGIVGLLIASCRKTLRGNSWLMLFAFVCIGLLLLAVGSAIRFISFFLIPATFFITLALISVGRYVKKPFVVGVIAVLFLAYESYFTLDLVFWKPADYGIVKLDRYFDSIFGGNRPAGLLRHPNPNLDKVIQKYAANRPATLDPIGIVYDDQISVPARLWLLSRRQYYQGIPIQPASVFLQMLKNSGGASLHGFQIYFVKAGPATTISPVRDGEYLKSLEVFWKNLPAETKNEFTGEGGRLAFSVARFSL